MQTRFEKKAAFKIAGLSVHDGVNSDFIGTWDKLYKQVNAVVLSHLGSGECFGASYDFKTQECFSYIAGYDVTDEAKAKLLGLDIVAVPAAEYLVVELHGPMPQCIKDGWAYVNETYFPGNNFVHAGTPDFELYFDGDPKDPDYQMELWILVVAKE